MPGFDPGRALTRPSGEFLLLRDVRLSVRERPEAGVAVGDHALVNRYAVERIRADLMLGFFFPGAVVRRVGRRLGARAREPRPSARWRSRPPAPPADGLSMRMMLGARPGVAGPRTQRPGLGLAIGDEAFLDGPRDRVAEHPLDAAQQVGLVDADERDGLAGRAGPARPADAVDVVLRVPRQLEVDDDRQVLDVEAARRDVGRDQDPDRRRS